MLIVSPWTKGGWVCSQVFDHTSVLQFLEARFGVAEPNISKWRRSVCGDLTSAFDFSGTPDSTPYQFAVPLPIISKNEPPQVPAVQSMPMQESGTRPARALPYKFYIDSRVDIANEKFWVDLINEGKVGTAFYIYSTKQPQENPRRYTVSASQRLSDYWKLSELRDGHKLSVYGPNGHLSEFSCDPSSFLDSGAKPDATLRYDSSTGALHLTLRNTGSAPCRLEVINAYEADKTRRHAVAPGKSIEDRWVLSITQESAPGFLRRFAGHVEDGRPSTSDPAVFKEI
jgi:phospholipase C